MEGDGDDTLFVGGGGGGAEIMGGGDEVWVGGTLGGGAVASPGGTCPHQYGNSEQKIQAYNPCTSFCKTAKTR